MIRELIDGFGRRHDNLRISVTDRCNIRCSYCMPEDVEFQPREHLLSFEEMTRFSRIAAGLGVNKIRLTGGEPLLRQNLATLVEMLVAVQGIKDVGLTTNGVLLSKHAQELYEAGLRRINISLDALDGEKFKMIARRDVFEQVLEGIEAARKVGFSPIKINAVAMKGVTDDEVVRLARFCRERGMEMRFIEFMPLDADNVWERDKVLVADDILALLASAGMEARPVPSDDPHAPATEYEYVDGKGRLGIVASVSKPFCGSCNRIRLTADGKFRNCLFAMDEVDVKTPMRTGASDDAIADMIEASVKRKWAGHLINSIGFRRPERTMHTIGG